MYKHKEGVVFEKVKIDDLQFLHNLKKDTWWGTHSVPLMNIEDQIDWYNNLTDSSLFLTSRAENQSGIRFGVACYTNIDWLGRTMDISGTIAKGYRDSKIKNQTFVEAAFKAGTDFAFEMLNAHRLNAEVLETNYASLSLELDLLGFSYEGRKRKAVYKCGKYYDSIIVGLLREDWERQERILNYEGCCNSNLDIDSMQKNIVKSSQRCPIL